VKRLARGAEISRRYQLAATVY